MGRMRSALPSDLSRILRFGAVGLINAASLILGFFLNRQWTLGRVGGLRLVFVGGAIDPDALNPANARWPGAAR